MKYALREMEEKDILTIVQGEEKIFGESMGFDMIYTDLKMNPFAHYIVLEIDKEVRGYVGIWITDDGNADILNLYVDNEYQGYGFGNMLLEFVIELCSMSGVKQISLEVRVSNEKALNLYKKHNFEFCRVRNSYYSNGEDANVMILKLGE